MFQNSNVAENYIYEDIVIVMDENPYRSNVSMFQNSNVAENYIYEDIVIVMDENPYRSKTYL